MPHFTIAALRQELGDTLIQFGERIGLASKGQVSELERTERCSPDVALAIERVSGGRIDAGRLNETVAKARASQPKAADAA